MNATTKPDPIFVGKVRDTYPVDDPGLLLVVATDRISVFDVVLNQEVPGKGTVLTAMTEFWLRDSPVADMVDNHLVSTDPADFPEWAKAYEGRAMLVRRAEMLPVECIVRGYLMGSAWKEYSEKGTMHGSPMPEGMVQAEQLPAPTFTPSTKAEQGAHDENISIEEAESIVGDVVGELEVLSLEAYRRAAASANDRGILILDTKFEFGVVDGTITLCDEVLTPDSSRFTPADQYEPGKAPPSYDKEQVRQWALGTGWDKKSSPPDIPQEVIDQTVERYREVCQRLTGADPLS